ncbi:ArdC family protein [Prauserella oleivorans]|uniref:ArdC family protein n=1 Tax=Prauserella oleivorans TaxID=1478153 RepID=A0ABW5WCA2_9PSEU
MSNAVYQVITDRIVAMLEAGTAPWRQPWHAATSWPRSIHGHRYRGINVFLTLAGDHISPYWLTRKEIRRRGGRRREGEPGTTLIFFKKIEREDPETGEKILIPIARYYHVWNLEQVEGIDAPVSVVAPRVHTADERHAAAEAIVAGYKDRPEIVEAGRKACYQPALDRIKIPPRATFTCLDGYYATLFHELGHSTAHPSRLDRPIGYDFGSHPYGREELIAEMTAAFLAAESGIETTADNSAAYLSSWITTIREDVRAVVVAATAAHRATDHILGRANDHADHQAA